MPTDHIHPVPEVGEGLDDHEVVRPQTVERAFGRRRTEQCHNRIAHARMGTDMEPASTGHGSAARALATSSVKSSLLNTPWTSSWS
ncbi:MAG TPA: hypothetical protein VK348_00715, partial [Planctomycetota bacterium]|nr:hypothetical protein [Planctomycetota bacterium]